MYGNAPNRARLLCLVFQRRGFAVPQKRHDKQRMSAPLSYIRGGGLRKGPMKNMKLRMVRNSAGAAFIVAALFSAGMVRAQTMFSDVPGMTNIINSQFATNTGSAALLPPMEGLHFGNDLGLVARTNLGVRIYPLEIDQISWSIGEPRTRLYLNATGGIFHTDYAPVEFSPSNWVVSVYGNPGAWMTGTG